MSEIEGNQDFFIIKAQEPVILRTPQEALRYDFEECYTAWRYASGQDEREATWKAYIKARDAYLGVGNPYKDYSAY